MVPKIPTFVCALPLPKGTARMSLEIKQVWEGKYLGKWTVLSNSRTLLSMHMQGLNPRAALVVLTIEIPPLG